MKDFNSALYKLIGLRIKEARHRLNFSQDDLAKKILISRASISNIELGRHQPPLHVLYDISSVLKFDLQQLLPTFNEVKKHISTNEYSDILKNISSLDDESKKSIEEIIKNLYK
ncbi:MAG: helix-turn-helix domain-containing protein [Flavobacteriaceae bacterium]|nr:helix-turn-helix domain-containing protein [Flavobacteriaceae bacterium]